MREAREEITGALIKIFGSLLATDKVLVNCKIANTVPLFQMRNKGNLQSYRSVRLASVLRKLLMRILSDRIYSLLEENGLTRGHQYGFVSGKSCLTNLIEFF